MWIIVAVFLAALRCARGGEAEAQAEAEAATAAVAEAEAEAWVMSYPQIRFSSKPSFKSCQA